MRLLLFSLASVLVAQEYDLVIRGGHVIDPRNKISAVRDIAVKGDRIAAVAEKIDASRARRDGTVRDTFLYSILKSEWSDVKRHLALRLARHSSSRS